MIEDFDRQQYEKKLNQAMIKGAILELFPIAALVFSLQQPWRQEYFKVIILGYLACTLLIAYKSYGSLIIEDIKNKRKNNKN